VNSNPQKLVYDNILQTIGNTPLIKLNKIAEDIPAQVWAKVEYFNPGNSVKDRMALKMIEDAEKEGKIKPGGTIIECTSGNTGMGLALAAIVKGYKLICTLSDKQSKEKMDVLRAMGAEVYVCPTNVAPEHPESYYSVAERLNKEIPNSFYPYQYDNLSNRQAHYESTGPEIWEQTEGKITHFVVGVGTGGTISGVAKYLKEKNPNIKIWGIDTYGSVFKKYHETGEFDENEIYSYITEGIGEDILPKNVDFDLIDHFEKVTDKDGALVTRELARKEGLFLGYSAGSAFQGIRQLKDQLKPTDVVVVLFHDHGSRYVGKVFNDDWMRERGFMQQQNVLAKDLVDKNSALPLVCAKVDDKIGDVIALMRKYDISQVPIKNGENFVGSIDDVSLFQHLSEQDDIRDKSLENFMNAPFPIVSPTEAIEDIKRHFSKKNNAVMVDLGDGEFHIITRFDMMEAMR
jgi:cystathionine beta-synthase